MGYLLLPIAMVLFYVGLSSQAGQLTGSLPGAGQAGRMDVVSVVRAQQAETFGASCIEQASATAGLISANIAPVLPSGVVVPTKAVCMTTAATAGARNIFAFVPSVPGAAGAVAADTNMNDSWFQVQTLGTAINLVSGQASTVPTSIPAGSLLQWIQTSS
jgi:hypothetical protein